MFSDIFDSSSKNLQFFHVYFTHHIILLLSQKPSSLLEELMVWLDSLSFKHDTLLPIWVLFTLLCFLWVIESEFLIPNGLKCISAPPLTITDRKS